MRAGKDIFVYRLHDSPLLDQNGMVPHGPDCPLDTVFRPLLSERLTSDSTEFLSSGRGETARLRVKDVNIGSHRERGSGVRRAEGVVVFLPVSTRKQDIIVVADLLDQRPLD